jgi:hypothetical protein
MNYWLEQSIAYANQRTYLDDLFQVYPTVPEGIRELDGKVWAEVEAAFQERDDTRLLRSLLKLDLFPVKDSYVAYLRRDPSALDRNPATVARLCGRLYQMGLAEIYERSSEPKETNRQIGPLFRRWLQKGCLGVNPVPLPEFVNSSGNAVLRASEGEMKEFARQNLGYSLDKGLDLVARFNGKYIIGEAKFLTDFGGHQNAQFNDAVALFHQPSLKAIPVAILDGVLYIKGRSKMYRQITTTLREQNIVSALVLREFLYSV